MYIFTLIITVYYINMYVLPPWLCNHEYTVGFTTKRKDSLGGRHLLKNLMVWDSLGGSLEALFLLLLI